MDQFCRNRPLGAESIGQADKIAVGAGSQDIPIVADSRLEAIEYGVIFVEIAEPRPDHIVDGQDADGLAVHGQVPKTDRHVVAGKHVPAIGCERHIRDGTHQLGKETGHGCAPGALRAEHQPIGAGAVAERSIAQIAEPHLAPTGS